MDWNLSTLLDFMEVNMQQFFKSAVPFKVFLFSSGCYGIIEVPEGEWYCAKCTEVIARSAKMNGADSVMDITDPPRCELCPFGHGALKRTENGGKVFAAPAWCLFCQTTIFQMCQLVFCIYRGCFAVAIVFWYLDYFLFVC